MTSRENVLAAIAHRTPDRVPVDLGATPSSGISAIAYNNLVRYLGMDKPTLIYDVVQQLAQPDAELLERFGVDVLDIGRTFNTQPQDWYPITPPAENRRTIPRISTRCICPTVPGVRMTTTGNVC